MDHAEYLQAFIEETQENLQTINENLLALEHQPGDLDIINTIFRAAHTLKGMAGAMQFQHMAHLTHEMESNLDLMRSGELEISSETVDVLFEAHDVLQSQLNVILETSSDDGVNLSSILARLQTLGHGEVAATLVKDDAAASAGSASGSVVAPALLQSAMDHENVYAIHVTVDPSSPMPSVRAFMVIKQYESMGEVLGTDPEDVTSDAFQSEFTVLLASEADADALRNQALSVSEIASARVEPVSRTATAPTDGPSALEQKNRQPSPKTNDVSQGTPGSGQRHQAKSVRVDVDRLDTLMNLYSEFVIDKTRLEQIARKQGDSQLSATVQHLSRVGADLQDIIMKIRMIPLETVFNRFPRMVRDLSKSLGKQVNFEIYGADTEIDRVLADEISDPLVHILRNSMDHGLETPQERRQGGKPETGTVELKAYHAGNHVFIEIRDDGRGIDRERIVKKAIERGLTDVERSKTLSDEQVYDFLFHSGFSTAEKVSDISGRGVGLDAVKSKIESLSGDVTVQSVQGEGSTFLIRLPLTVSILSAMLVDVHAEKYCIPTNSIEHMDRMDEAHISTVQGEKLWNYRGRLIPFVYLGDAFHIPDANLLPDGRVAILRKGDKMLALAVDGFIGQQEVVLKSLGRYLAGQARGVSGATILGDGEVALILDVNTFIR